MVALQEDVHNLLEIVPVAVVVIDAHFRIRLVNTPAEFRLGIQRSDVGRTLSDVIREFSPDDLDSRLRECVLHGQSEAIEIETAAGRKHMVRIKPYISSNGRPDGAILSFEDIHELRTAQTDAQNSHLFAKSVVGTVETPLLVLKEDLRVKMVNEAFHQHFGTVEEDLEEQLFLEIQNNRFDLNGLREALDRVLGEETPAESFEVQHDDRGNLKHVSVTVRLVRPATEKMLLIALNDITARKEAEQVLLREQERLKSEVADRDRELETARHEADTALQESRTELLRSREALRHLTASLLHAQDAERRRVSRELHDDLSQKIAKLQFDIEILEQDVPFTDLDAARSRLRAVSIQAGKLSEDLRRVAHRLHPSMLDNLGLVVALRSFTGEFSRSHYIRVDLSTADIPKAVPIETAGCIYRIAQEALRNAAKHARATRVDVFLACEGSELTLEVRDNGCGFDMHDARTKGGLGLVGIEERARLVGGALTIDTEPGRGTCIMVRVPLEEPCRPAS